MPANPNLDQPFTLGEYLARTAQPRKAAFALCLFLLPLLLLSGCSSDQGSSQTANPDPAPPSASEPTTAPAGDQTIEAAGLRFTLPAGWEREQPSSNMRAAQAIINGAGGKGQLTVFFFGTGGGGPVDDNLNRWVGQVQGSSNQPVRDQFETGDFLVTTISHAGTLKASTMGTFPTADQPDYALLGAVVEGPGGPWFFKAVGPKATLDEQAAGFRTMLENLGT